MRVTDATSLEKNPVKALTARPDLADSYRFVNSQLVLSAFADAGWQPVAQQALLPRRADRMGFQKHLVRLENPAYPSVPGLEGSAASRPQLIVLNSHDKASSLRLTWGMWRFVCLNGLIMGDALAEIRLNHSANVMKRLPDAIGSMIDSFPKLIDQVTALRRKQLSEAAIGKLIQTVYDARLHHVKTLERVDYTLPLLRREDNTRDAFTVFNRIQEVAIRGGIRYTYNRQVRNSKMLALSHGTSRRVNSIDESLKLNQLAYATALDLA
jgi:hypothetical protein